MGELTNTKSIALLGNATRMLAEVKTIDDAKHLMDLAASAKLYAKKHQLGKDAVGYAHEIELEAEIKLGEILLQTEKNKGSKIIGRNEDNSLAVDNDDRQPTLSELGINKDLSSEAQALAQLPDDERLKIKKGVKGKRNAIKQHKKKNQITLEIETRKQEQEQKNNIPSIYNEGCFEFLQRFESKSVDLLITDPPYSTDIPDIPAFLNGWLYDALDKVKDTGRAFICIGAYPTEIYDYLNFLLPLDWIIDCPLVWTYRNTLGVTPKMKYNLNYQIILHLYRDTSILLDTGITNEMFSVQDINAPDGRQGDRFYKWQKPDMLAERLIRHTTKQGDKIIDPFAGSGSFILKAAEIGRQAWGCEINPDVIMIAKERGCSVRL
jgi:DNA modification methylase